VLGNALAGPDMNYGPPNYGPPNGGLPNNGPARNGPALVRSGNSGARWNGSWKRALGA
jgi:hypothetical protein